MKSFRLVESDCNNAAQLIMQSWGTKIKGLSNRNILTLLFGPSMKDYGEAMLMLFFPNVYILEGDNKFFINQLDNGEWWAISENETEKF